MEGILLPVVVLLIALIALAEWRKIGALYIPAILLMLWVSLFIGETLVYLATAGMIAITAMRVHKLIRS